MTIKLLILNIFPLSVELSNNNFNSLEVQSYLVKDLNNNFMIDSITTISKRGSDKSV